MVRLECLDDVCWECGTIIEARIDEDKLFIIERYTTSEDYRQGVEMDRTKLRVNVHLAGAAFELSRTSVRERDCIADRTKLKMKFVQSKDLEVHFKKPMDVLSKTLDTHEDIEGNPIYGKWFLPDDVPPECPSLSVSFFRDRYKELMHATVKEAENIRHDQADKTYDRIVKDSIDSRAQALRMATYMRATRFSEFQEKADKHDQMLHEHEKTEIEAQALRDLAANGDATASRTLGENTNAVVSSSSRFRSTFAPLVASRIPVSAITKRGVTPVIGSAAANTRAIAAPVLPRVATVVQPPSARQVTKGVPAPGTPLPKCHQRSSSPSARSDATTLARSTVPIKAAPGSANRGKSKTPIVLAVDAAAVPDDERPDGPGSSVTCAWQSKTGKPFPTCTAILQGYQPGREIGGALALVSPQDRI
jgi:hypothetical protein